MQIAKMFGCLPGPRGASVGCWRRAQRGHALAFSAVCCETVPHVPNRCVCARVFVRVDACVRILALAYDLSDLPVAGLAFEVETCFLSLLRHPAVCHPSKACPGPCPAAQAASLTGGYVVVSATVLICQFVLYCSLYVRNRAVPGRYTSESLIAPSEQRSAPSVPRQGA